MQIVSQRSCALLDRSLIAEVLAKTDIVTLIGSHVSLRRQGAGFTGLCPFHAERTPSFHVRPDRGFFKCFGCGAGGDAIKFIEQIENVGFPDAIRILAGRAGVEIREETPEAAQARDRREVLYEANAVAAEFFARCLREAPEAAAAREYCAARGLDAVAIERFQLGYAPDSWNALRDALRAAGVAEDAAQTAGLLKEGRQGSYDFYRNRLMIPVTALTGEIVAFGGRALGGEEPKYLNTAGTPIYTKGKLLYALTHARRAVKNTEAFIIVEGYLDCIALQRAGFEHAVASLGTAFTPEQAQLLRRFATNIYLAFDADTAGAAATIKSLDILADAGCRVRIVDLPPGEDPDTFVRTKGTAAFQALLDASRRAAEVLIDHRLASLQSGFASANDVIPEAEAVVRMQPRAEWDRWRLYVADRLKISVDDLRRSIGPVHREYRPAVHDEAGSAARNIAPAPKRERDILAVLVEEPALIREYRDRISLERFSDARLARLYELLLATERLDSAVDVLVAANGDELASAGFLLLASGERSATVRYADGDERRRMLDDICKAFAREEDESRRRTLNEQIDAHLAAGTTVPPELLEAHAAIQSRLHRILKGKE